MFLSLLLKSKKFYVKSTVLRTGSLEKVYGTRFQHVFNFHVSFIAFLYVSVCRCTSCYSVLCKM